VDPSFFLTRTTGEDQGLEDGSITPIVNILLTSSFSVSLSTSLGLYQFTVTPFGLSGSPSTFQRLLQNVLRGLQWEECLLYMDDIIVPGATFEENLQRLKHTLDYAITFSWLSCS
jgi:hypothetical protein